jgi:multiple sugar transport system permease protein
MAQAKLSTVDNLSGRRRKSLRAIVRANSGFLFVAPAMLIFLVFGFYTVIYSGFLSFFRWNGFGKFSLLPYDCGPPSCQFVGLDNFTEFLYMSPTESHYFWLSLQNNVVIAVVVTLGTIIIALPLATALSRALKFQGILRTLIMLPTVTAGIAIYYVWSFIFQSDGLLNNLLDTFGLGFLQAKQGWLSQSDRALPALMVVMIWSAVPLATILYMAGIQTINRELYESGILDGANAFQLLRHITWPLLYPITVIIMITSINSAFQGYEMVYLMTGGGPAGHTEVVGLQVFEYGFGKSQQLGLASAMSWLLFLVVFVIALINLRFFRAKD